MALLFLVHALPSTLGMAYSRLKRKDELYAIEECRSYRLNPVSSIYDFLRYD